MGKSVDLSELKDVTKDITKFIDEINESTSLNKQEKRNAILGLEGISRDRQVAILNEKFSTPTPKNKPSETTKKIIQKRK